MRNVKCILLIVFISRFGQAEYKNLPRSQSIVSLMTAAIVVPVFFLSLINHQEARFLLPLTLPVIFLHAPKLQNGFCTTYPFLNDSTVCHFIYKKILSPKASAGGFLLKWWFAFNIVLTLFFGFVHQGGVFQLATHLSGTIAQLPKGTNVHTHLVTSHIYSIPMSFFFLPSTQTMLTNYETGQKYRRKKRFFVYEYGSTDMDILYKKLKLILDLSEMKASTKNQKYQLYLAIPSSLSEQLSLAFWRSNSTLVLHERVKVFYPHLSTEALPQFFVRHLTEIKTNLYNPDKSKCSLYEEQYEHEHGDDEEFLSVGMMLKQFSSVIHQFGLALYRIDVGRKNRSFMQ